jgi:hypothetical protein
VEGEMTKAGLRREKEFGGFSNLVLLVNQYGSVEKSGGPPDMNKLLSSFVTLRKSLHISEPQYSDHYHESTN